MLSCILNPLLWATLRTTGLALVCDSCICTDKIVKQPCVLFKLMQAHAYNAEGYWHTAHVLVCDVAATRQRRSIGRVLECTRTVS